MLTYKFNFYFNVFWNEIKMIQCLFLLLCFLLDYIFAWDCVGLVQEFFVAMTSTNDWAMTATTAPQLPANLSQQFFHLFFDTHEPRLDNGLPLLKLYQVMASISIYVTFATLVGPYLMAKRLPFKLKWAMVLYNFTLVAINCRIHYSAIQWVWREGKAFDFVCPDRNDWRPATLLHLKAMYIYYLTKYADWMDTVFFVLRKKQSHVSVLHLYHHSAVPFLGWYCLTRGKLYMGKNGN